MEKNTTEQLRTITSEIKDFKKEVATKEEMKDLKTSIDELKPSVEEMKNIKNKGLGVWHVIVIISSVIAFLSGIIIPMLKLTH